MEKEDGRSARGETTYSKTTVIYASALESMTLLKLLGLFKNSLLVAVRRLICNVPDWQVTSDQAWLSLLALILPYRVGPWHSTENLLCS